MYLSPILSLKRSKMDFLKFWSHGDAIVPPQIVLKGVTIYVIYMYLEYII